MEKTEEEEKQETKILKREDIEKLGKVVSVSKSADVQKNEAIKQLIKDGEIPQVYEAKTENKPATIKKPKKRISMKRTTKNTEPRVLKFLAKRKPTKARIIAKYLGFSRKQDPKTYYMLANLLLRMHRDGLIKKVKTGVYFVPNEKTKGVVSIGKNGRKGATPEVLAKAREVKRQKHLLHTGGQQFKELPLKTLNNGKIINAGQRLSGFRLIKSYPNCPYAIGVVIPGSNDLFNYPEYWQPQYQVSEPEHNPQDLKKAWELMQQAMDLLKKATLK